MSAFTELDSTAITDTSVNTNPLLAEGLIPASASYLIAADNHQIGNTNSSIFDPSTWGDRADSVLKFSVSTLTRAVASTYNSAVSVGSMVGLADTTDMADTKQWLQGMDDDLGKYYDSHKESVDTWGDVAAMFAPGLAGVKVLNWGQKSLALATEGRAGLSLASHLGTLPTKQAQFAEMAAMEMKNTQNPFSIINANLAKSIGTGLAQNALELAAFNTAAAVTMRSFSPIFKDEDASDIAYNSILGAGFTGVGIMGSAAIAKTYMDVRKAGNAVDKVIKPLQTVKTEPVSGTPQADRIAIHIDNIQAVPVLKALIPSEFAQQSERAAIATIDTEINNGRLAATELTGNGDSELGVKVFDTLNQFQSNQVAMKTPGLAVISRAGVLTKAENAIKDTKAVVYMKLTGSRNEGGVEGTFGTLVSEAPALTLADKFRSTEEVLAETAKYKHSQGQKWSILDALDNPHNADARYITAMESTFNPEVAVGARDIPYLEKAYEYLKSNTATIDTVKLTDGRELGVPELTKYLTELKSSEANILRENTPLVATKAGAVLSEYDIASIVNVAPSYLLDATLNLKNPASDWFQRQATMQVETAAAIANGTWRENKGMIKTYLQPTVAKMVYDTSKIADADMDLNVVKGMVGLKQDQAIYRQQAKNVTDLYLKEEAQNFPDRITKEVLTTSNRSGVGIGMLGAMNQGYRTIGSVAQLLGSLVTKIAQKSSAEIDEIFATSGHKIFNNPEADTEVWKIAQLVQQTPENYTLQNGVLRNMKLVAYENKVAAAKAEFQQLQQGTDIRAILKAKDDLDNIPKPVYEDTKAPVEIPLVTDGGKDWASTLQQHNSKRIVQQRNLRNSQGLTVQEGLEDRFYIPPPSPRDFPHFAFVVDQTPTSTGHVSMIHANTASDLEALANKVPTEQGFKVIFKGESEDFHKALGNYEYDLGINENYINTALKRSGASGAFFPVTDGREVFNRTINWAKQQEIGLLRDMVEHKYSAEFAELRRQGERYGLAESSVKGYVADAFKKVASNPYNDIVNTALGYSHMGSAPLWQGVNRLAETSIATIASKLQGTFDKVKTVEDLALLNNHLRDIGVNVFTDAATAALANHSAPTPVLSKFIQSANSLLTFFMLKADPSNAATNFISRNVLATTEIPNLIKDTMTATGGAAADALGHIAIPGTAAKILSPLKLIAEADAYWLKNVAGRNMATKGDALWEKFAGWNLLPNYTDQMRNMNQAATLIGNETPIMLNEKRSAMLAAAKKIDAFASTVSGNNMIEQGNRFRSAYVAYKVANEAVKAGVITEDVVSSIVNTFVNRVEGNSIASQRPLLLQGPIGKAIGLFQSYQFNFLQQLFRHVGEGNNKSTAMLLGLQGSINGLNGLPAFNFMNTHIIGTAGGNVDHSDIYTKTYDTLGHEAGNWLLYGLSSNMLIHPDAKVNLYSRGDINPRQLTVIPTTLADVPIVGATTKFIGSMYEAAQKINKGSDIFGAFLQGVEHANISRPLAGLAQVLQAVNNPYGSVVSTTNKGDISMQNDLYSAMTLARLAGSKPLDEATTLDAHYRVQVYSGARLAQIENLGESIKATVLGGKIPTSEQINGFASEYARAGGDQLHFNKFFTTQVLNANKSNVNQLVENANNPFSKYMQKIMGGYELSDFVNSKQIATTQ
jgi:hypothetical protein